MAKQKKVIKIIKLQIEGGKANPAPPVGTALGPVQVPIMDFCKQFNAATQDRPGVLLPTEITVYADKSFTFITKQPPAAVMIKKKANVAKGSGVPNRDKVGKLTMAQVEEIAKEKEQDMNATSLEGAMQMIMGTARSMGIEVEG